MKKILFVFAAFVAISLASCDPQPKQAEAEENAACECESCKCDSCLCGEADAECTADCDSTCIEEADVQ